MTVQDISYQASLSVICKDLLKLNLINDLFEVVTLTYHSINKS